MIPEKRRIDQVQDLRQIEPPTSKRHVDGEGTTPSFRINYPTNAARTPTPVFQYPNQLITFSYSESRDLEFNDAAMKYYVQPPFNADLSYAYDTWIKRPEERGRLDGLLKACLREEVIPERNRTNIISWRGVMTKILTAPCEDRESWNLNVMCVNDTLYFEEHMSNEKLKEKENMTPRNRLQTYFGYAFESYCTSSAPDPKKDPLKLPNGWSGNVNTNVQWCSVVKTKLGDNRIIIGGEVDCVEDKYTGQPNTYVELKTSLAIRDQRDEARFDKKLLKFYFQSFLLGVPEIKVGFRTPAGRLTQLQSFKTVHLPRLVRGKPGAWDPNMCLQWGVQFLGWLKSTIRNWDFQHDSVCPKEECVWRVSFQPGVGVEMALLDEDAVADVRNREDRVGFLPRFYWDQVGGSSRSESTNGGSIERIEGHK